MVKQAIVALTLVALLAPGRARADMDVDEAFQAFMTVHGPMTMLELEQDGSGVWFAGMFTSAPLGGDADLAAMAFLEKWQGLWGFDPAAHLEVADVTTLATVTYVKLDQMHDGVRVQDSGVKVTLDRWNQVRQVALRFGRSQGYADATPTLSLEAVRAIFNDKLPELEPTGQSRLAYLADPHGLARLAWVLRSHARGSHEAPEAYIDAHTGEVHERASQPHLHDQPGRHLRARLLLHGVVGGRPVPGHHAARHAGHGRGLPPRSGRAFHHGRVLGGDGLLPPRQDQQAHARQLRTQLRVRRPQLDANQREHGLRERVVQRRLGW
ncbi:MAG: hypothetical protein JRG91_07720 [Deltaproteobacteria bacterium]|nr:hypothetical protein [Deltaproteobacteria bacterium]